MPLIVIFWGMLFNRNYKLLDFYKASAIEYSNSYKKIAKSGFS